MYVCILNLDWLFKGVCKGNSLFLQFLLPLLHHQSLLEPLCLLPLQHPLPKYIIIKSTQRIHSLQHRRRHLDSHRLPQDLRVQRGPVHVEFELAAGAVAKGGDAVGEADAGAAKEASV